MKRAVPYIPHTEEDITRMCAAIGVGSVEELLKAVPGALRLKGSLRLPEGLSEHEVNAALERISKKNASTKDYSSFLGAGSYNHYIPAAIDQLISRSEFYTSYTPYQPEISQGTLQAIFEYQTLVCQLTGMDVSNASLYDGASATAEAALMAKRVTGRKKVLVSAALHPEYRETVKTYLKGRDEPYAEILYCAEAGVTLAEAVEKSIDNDTACLIVQQPNFFGCVEDIEALATIAKKNGTLLVVSTTEPLSLALLRPPGELGADISVGEGQSFGNSMNYGGPYLGYMAVKSEYIRSMPGRIVGQTLDKNGLRSFCLTFSTREQHIRRERATSNICTNEGLSALSAAIYLSLLGKNGLSKLAETNLSKAIYLKNKLLEIKGVKTAFTGAHFNEFTIELNSSPKKFLNSLRKEGIIGGLPLEGFHPSLKRHVLVTTTEMNSAQELDRYASMAKKILTR